MGATPDGKEIDVAVLGQAGKRGPFDRRVTGTWGQLSTPAGSVPYVLTNARLSRNGVDEEARLLRDLLPVREALPDLGKDDFGVLLQRPLDDHRVASRLIPYLLESVTTGVPSFFPSILVAALPFSTDGKPLDKYDDAAAPVVQDADANFVYGRHKQQVFGEMFKVSRLWHQDENVPHNTALAVFEWAHEKIKLVILDGQHRAMSLLALQRAVAGWPNGNSYEEFYARVTVDDDLDIEQIRIPVTLVWFPPHDDVALDPVKVARSMFVTVNNEARRVGEARILMLNDSELTAIFTRALLEAMRNEHTATEQRVLSSVLFEDDPRGGSARAETRWPTITDLRTLSQAVSRTIFLYNASQVTRPLVRGSWTPNSSPAAPVMRERLEITTLFEVANEQHFDPEELANGTFPDEWVDALKQKFLESWGGAILWLYSTEGPFGAHVKALERLRNDWDLTTGAGRLAAEAAFESTGMWGVLRTHYESWDPNTPRQQTNPMLAWEIILGKKQGFESLRAQEYVQAASSGALTSEDAARTLRLFDTFKTEACQVGLVAAMTWLVLKMPRPFHEAPNMAKALARALNQALQSNGPGGVSRRFSLARRTGTIGEPPTLNLFEQRLKPSDSTHFRYMWLQLLAAEEARQQLRQDLDPQLAEDLIRSAELGACLSRPHYLKALLSPLARQLRLAGTPNPEQTAKDRLGVALSDSLNELFGTTYTSNSVWECETAHLAEEEELGGNGPEVDELDADESDEEE